MQNDQAGPLSSAPSSPPVIGQDSLEIAWEADRTKIEKVSISAILPADSPRLTGEDAEHIQRLAASDAKLPPIVVHRATMRVIDGMHRLHAACERAQEVIDVRFFEGSDHDAFVLAVKLNVEHGLPLSRADRTAAAHRILTMYPAWSNRLIASVTGLSAGTIKLFRHKFGATANATVRVGRDGRHRPLDAVAGRLAASRVVTRRPDASLREIAREAGVSLATARDVRERIQHGEDPLPPLHRARNPTAGADGPEVAAWAPAEPADIADTVRPARAKTSTNEAPAGHRPTRRGHLTVTRLTEDEPDVAVTLNNLANDPSLRFTESGRRLLRWLFATSKPLKDWSDIIDSIPPHCSYMVAELARQCAEEWLGFAAEMKAITDRAG
ncbi:ParB N-terminal domain-containing protein [Paractinoplanes ferrugineus]|uniref:ParB-like N-terminal domain-containing protein n=1 Tax=Paractinoplanes ferrugineus TaxID=113564 RepID=A0A919J3H3_9ACTN|nr:ParB/RepB/Spo0J family partition protein [Actinoplanes ferrugineus]GIE13265.1 hypothetical protein Afe05nite_51050 [Actinoplanes ferrugineus]